MEVYILNSTLQPIATIDTFRSLIWTKRYYNCGDFELYIPADKSLLPLFSPDNFVARDDDDSVMCIERLEIRTDIEDGDFFIVSGRSLESILARRIVGSQTIITVSDVVQGLKELVTEWTTYIDLTIDDSLTYEYEMSTQLTGDNLLDAVSAICTRFGIGLRMTIDGDGFLLAFYQGEATDVVFSPEFDNLTSSSYVMDYTDYANYCKVLGEGEGTSRIGVNIHRSPQELGIKKRCIFVDAKDISRNGGDISSADYLPMLIERGWEKLEEHRVTQSFEAQIDPVVSYKYKTDYDLGDTVTFENAYGITARARIVEIIECWDENGYTIIPNFDKLEVQ